MEFWSGTFSFIGIISIISFLIAIWKCKWDFNTLISRLKSVFRQDPIAQERTFSDIYHLAIKFVPALKNLKETCFISMESTTWFFTLGPSIFLARLNGIEIKILCREPKSEKEKIRINALLSVGCKLKFVPHTEPFPKQMFIFDSRSPYSRTGSFIYPQHLQHQNLFATYYSENIDSEILDVASEYSENIYSSVKEEYFADGDIKVEEIEKSEIIRLLRKGVHQYSNNDVQIEFKSIQLQSLEFFSSKLYFSKLDQVDTILELYKIENIKPFEPIAVVSNYGRTIITPPLIEEKNGVYYVINGTHRTFYYLEKNRKEMYCIVVSNVSAPLPGDSVPSRKLTVHKGAQSSRVNNLDYSKFRHVEAAMHPNDFDKSIEEMLTNRSTRLGNTLRPSG